MTANTVGTEPVTPKIVVAPKIGDLAPGTAPAPISAEAMQKLIDEAVDARVKEALGERELTPQDINGNDPIFNDFSKKLELFGYDLENLQSTFHLHWINEVGDRIFRMQAQGYTFVTRKEVVLNDNVSPLNQDLGENIAVYAGTTEQGGPMRTYLMKIPKEVYERKQASIQRVNDTIDEAIRRGTVGPAGTTKNSYAGTDQGQTKIDIGTRQSRVPSR